MPDFKDVSVTVGMKVWATQWSTWFFNTSGSPVNATDVPDFVYSGVYNRDASTEATFIPQLTFRSGPWLVSGSALVRREFTFFLSEDRNLDRQLDMEKFERKEYDINFGYAVAPNLAVTLGYKQLQYEGGGYRYKAKGPTIGVSGSAPLMAAVSMYGTLGYGRPKISEGLSSEKRGNYFLTEVGLAVPLGQMHDNLRSVVLTAGYRYQKLTSDSATVTTRTGTGVLLGSREVDLVDTTEGITVGVSATF